MFRADHLIQTNDSRIYAHTGKVCKLGDMRPERECSLVVSFKLRNIRVGRNDTISRELDHFPITVRGCAIINVGTRTLERISLNYRGLAREPELELKHSASARCQPFWHALAV